MCDDYDPEAEDKRDNNPAMIRVGKQDMDDPAGFKAKLVEEFGEYGIDENNDNFIIEVDPDAELRDKALNETRELEGMEKAEDPMEEVYREHCLTKKEEMQERIEQLVRQHKQEQD